MRNPGAASFGKSFLPNVFLEKRSTTVFLRLQLPIFSWTRQRWQIGPLPFSLEEVFFRDFPSPLNM